MTKKYQENDFVNLKCSVFRDAFAKAYIVHSIQTGKALRVKNIDINIGDTTLYFDSETPNFPFMFSMLSDTESVLKDFSDKRISDYYINTPKTKRKNDYKNIALCSLLLGVSRQYETDRFLNLWTSMNAYYTYLADAFETKIANEESKELKSISSKFKVKKIDNPSIGLLMSMIKNGAMYPKNPNNDENYKAGYQEANKLLVECCLDVFDLCEHTKSHLNNYCEDNHQYAKLYKMAETLGIPLYCFLLLVYPYKLRCDYFHGSAVQPIVSAYNSAELFDLKIVNYFLIDFLSKKVPKMFEDHLEIISDTDYQSIKDYLNKRNK